MAKRQAPRTDAGERRSDKSKRPAGSAPARERSGQRDSGHSWVHDEPQLEQGDEPHHSGYSDRETPEADRPGPHTQGPGERRPSRPQR